MKRIEFLGDSHKRIRSFAPNIKRRIGHELRSLQQGLQPSDFRPMSTIGLGVEELRVRDGSGAYRVVYIARIREAVYVLHAFQKKTRQTGKLDIELARKRYQQVMGQSHGQ